MSNQEGSGQPNPAEKSGPEVGQMRNGDYCVHVFIQEGKQFKADKADLSTPMIQITVNGKAKYSASKKDVGKTSTVYWGEHLFFELNNVSRNEIESSQIQIRVLNKGMFKDDTIGAYDFDVTFVYFQDKHTMFNSWIAFSNPEGKDFNEITCYLKLGISITGPGDDQVALNDETGPAGTEEQAVMMPPSIKKEYKQLKIRFIKGEKFPKMDMGGTIDAYFQTVYFKKKLTTQAVTQSKTTQDALIEQEFWLPIQWPLATDRLVLKVYDKDSIKDEIVGSMFFSMKQLVRDSGEKGLLKWYNLYGSPLGCRGDNTDKMNEYPEYASTWKGRTLMHISSVDTKNPEMKVDKLNQEFKQQIIKSGAYDYQEFEFICEFGGGISLPGKKKYTVRIQINDFIAESKKAIEQKGNYNRWSERIASTVFKGPYKSIEELGRVYIYLMDGDEPICFWKGNAADFKDTNPKYRWFSLQVDQAKGKVKNSWDAGLVQLKMSISHKTVNGTLDFSKMDAWKKPPPKRLSSWKIRCFIFQCKDIPSADDDGASDPFISIWNPDDKKIVTQVVEDNINPIFFEVQELYYDFDNIANAPPVVLNIWDHDDSVLDGDDYLGRCVVYLNEAAIVNDDTIPQPKWHDIKIGFNETDPASGQMLISFSVVEDDYAYKIPFTYLKLTEEIEYREYNVEINVLGLRNMESFGLLPVKKPFIRFNLRSLLPPEKAQAVTNIKTQPSATGSNPNINTVINFTIDLPVDPLFCPKLQCDVYDYVYKGLMQPLLGTFSLSIGEIMHQLRKEREDLLIDSDNIISQLKSRLQALDNESMFQVEEDKREGDDDMAFDKRVSGLNQIADLHQQQQTDSSLISADKQKLIEGPSVPLGGEEGDTVRDEESKELLGKQPSQSPVKLDIAEGQMTPELENELPITPEGQGSRSNTKVMKQKGGLGGNIFRQGTSLTRDVQAGLNFNLILKKQETKEQEKLKLKQDRLDDKKKLKEQGVEVHKNVLFPTYVMDERLKMKREAKPKPPATMFYEVGFDKEAPETDDKRNKHYRRFYDDELENVKELFPKKAFHTSDIIRGQSRGLSKGFFSWGFLAKKTDESGEATNLKTVGMFKGRLNIENIKEKEQFKSTKQDRMTYILKFLNDIHSKKFGNPMQFALSDLESFEKTIKFEETLEDLGCEQMNILPFLKEQSYQEMISRMLLAKTKCIIRLYMLEGYEFAQKDIGSFSDPYLKIRCGTKKFNERENYQLDQPNPKFHKLYEFDAEFPGAAPVTIKAFDYDDLFGDDLIGKTVIDLDDRFFCPEWQQIEDKPIEYRSLLHPSSQVPQGTVILWLEIHSSQAKATPKTYDVKPQPILDYEVRLIIYDTKDVPCEDVEGTSDVFFTCYIDDKDKKETDCHYRCQNGKASFNYRLLYNVKAPRNNCNLTIQVWDRDLFKSNDFIGEMQVPLALMFEDAIATQKPMNVNKKYYNSFLKDELDKVQGLTEKLGIKFHDEDSFYINLGGKEGKSGGKVRIGLNITPGEMAKANPVGNGRSEPNQSPFLPPPVGRISFSLNPFTMLNQLVGPELRRKIYCYCCVALCVVLCVALLPMVMSGLITQGLMKVF